MKRSSIDTNECTQTVLPNDILMYIFMLLDKVSATCFFLCSHVIQKNIMLLLPSLPFCTTDNDFRTRILKKKDFISAIVLTEYPSYELLIWADEYKCELRRSDYNIISELSNAAEMGKFDFVKWFIVNKGSNYNACTFSSAALSGNFEMLKWLKKIDCQYDRFLTVNSVLKGNMSILKWLETEKYLEIDSYVISKAALRGSLKIVKWLRIEKKCTWTRDTSINATRSGNIILLKWLKENGCPWDDKTICELAAEKGHFEMLKWLLSPECGSPEVEASIVRCVVKGGRLDMLKWLKEVHHCSLDDILLSKWACEIACEYEKMHQKKPYTDTGLDILKWLIENGCLWDSSVFYVAAEGGCFETMKWLRENGCPWDNSISKIIVRIGNLDILKWLKENGCPWNYVKACYDAWTYNYDDMYKWLINHEDYNTHRDAVLVNFGINTNSNERI